MKKKNLVKLAMLGLVATSPLAAAGNYYDGTNPPPNDDKLNAGMGVCTDTTSNFSRSTDDSASPSQPQNQPTVADVCGPNSSDRTSGAGNAPQNSALLRAKRTERK